MRTKKLPCLLKVQKSLPGIVLKIGLNASLFTFTNTAQKMKFSIKVARVVNLKLVLVFTD